jgi:hypothetical protein
MDVRVTDTNAKLYHHRDPAKVIATQEKEKKQKYLKASCLEQRRHFTPFMCSTDGLLGHEATTFAKHAWLSGNNLCQTTHSKVGDQMAESVLTGL